MPKMMNQMKRAMLTCVVMGSMLLSGCGTTTNNADNATNSPANSTATTTEPQQWSSEPAMTIDTHATYDAIVHTNYGNFTIQLFAKESPYTVNNFIFLAEHHFYDHCQFFRIIRTFMIQTGDPTNTGTGGPGYQFADELPPKHPYGPGIVAMANAGPNTNGSQFFICTGPDSRGLQPNYTQFGQVVSGMDVVQKIAAIPVTTNPNMPTEVSKPLKVAEIESIDITKKTS
jgi:cyclophilin family peptidyl-prolyl cis-trans isomerase